MDETKYIILKEKFARLDKELLAQGKIVRDTKKGIWGAANIEVCWKLFKRIGLQNVHSFLDLGCGDGRIVLLASLFTKAAGIEYDKELVETGKKIKQEVGLPKANIIQGDYFEYDVSTYDSIFINPDTGFYNKVEEKLLKEFKGVLLNYNNVFLPRFLKQGKRHWIDGVPITEYVAKDKEQNDNPI